MRYTISKMLPRIKIKRALSLLGLFLIFSVCFLIYMSRDLSVFLSMKQSIWKDYQDNKWLHFEDRLKQLEKDFNKHHKEVGEIKQAIKVLVPPPSLSSSPVLLGEYNKRFQNLQVTPISEILYDHTCSFRVDYLPTTDIQMSHLYKELPFDDPDGGAWKQGWKIEIDPLNWNKEHKLKVFVVPHSHNDPGWIKTVEEYYIHQTKHILDNMIVKLQEDPRRKFIWAEISFFSMWWDDLEQDDQDIVKRLIRNNQLEIVTGGWVMNDEANSHWISVLHQLTEGHQWLHTKLNYTPISHWSIDPFGMSSTQPMLLKQMGLDNLLIQRVHYAIKKQFSKQRTLEFKWKQTWDESGNTEIFTHLMPFYSYDIPHTCGPDPKICCQFDFNRLPGRGVMCPWKIEPQTITDTNVAFRAEMLLDQYRKKSTLYKTNVLLVPLGDDFRYTHSTEWDVQFKNYQRLFDFMNSNIKMHVQAQFGTLSDYFNAVHAEKALDAFPALSGDFFTYADRNDHYWSGYYTSRPFYKRMERVLLSYIRAAEIILTMARLSGRPGSKWIATEDIGVGKRLTDARRSLALFQHHDGITGTSKDHVVIDYGNKMLQAIKAAQNVIQLCTNLLLVGPGADIPGTDTIHYNIDDIRHNHDSLSEQHTITIGPELSIKRIAIFNSLPFSRQEVVTFLLSTPFVEVLTERNKLVKCQVSPIFEYGSTMSQSKYQVSFIAVVSALGIVSYTIQAIKEDAVPGETTYASIKIFNQFADVKTPPGFKDIDVSSTGSEFTLQNGHATAAFNKLGLLKAIKVATNTTPVHLDFVRYGVRPLGERSGAYLFLPDGPATSLAIENTIVNVIEGSILSSVLVQLPYVQHKVILFNTAGADGLGLEIHNLVNIAKTSNFEIAMRLSTNIKSDNQFFTDLNGYQMLRRTRLEKLPLQANFYPMPAMAFIEDPSYRLSIVTGSPLGCASLKSGQIEIMLDRRLGQDDNLGLGQGVLDNRPTKHVFRILLERKRTLCESTFSHHPSGFQSISGHIASQSLLNPLIQMLKSDDDDISATKIYSPAIKEFGVDFVLASLRTGVVINNEHYIGIVLQRQYLDVCFTNNVLLKQFPLSNGSVNVSSLLPQLEGTRKFWKSSLSYLTMKEHIDFQSNIPMCPMQIQAFVLKS